MKLAYIAGSYRNSNAKVVIENIRHAEKYAIKYWRLGYAVICPHLNTTFFDSLDSPIADETWLKGDIEILKRCDVIVLIPGWKKSSGAREEMKTALQVGLAIIEED